MTRAKTFVVLLAVVGLSAGAALGQSTTYVTLGTWVVNRDNANSQDSNEQHWNSGGDNSSARVWARVEQYYGDWDTATMGTEITALDLGSSGYPTPVYKLWVGISDWSEGYPDPPGTEAIRITSLWSMNDWEEGDGAGRWPEYNWTDPGLTFAATHMYAEDIYDMVGSEIAWRFPGAGDGTGYLQEQDCTFWGTFVPLDDPNDGYYNSCHWWTRSLDNGTDFQVDSTMENTMVSVVLDQAMIDDLLTHEDNRGLILRAITAGPKREVYMTSHQGGAWAMNITVGFDAWSGDGNLDGCVDGLDYVSWSNNYNLDPSSWPEGDYNLDGKTDGLDYVVWSNNYNAGCPPPGAVPEPATMALLAMGALALLKRRRRS